MEKQDVIVASRYIFQFAKYYDTWQTHRYYKSFYSKMIESALCNLLTCPLYFLRKVLICIYMALNILNLSKEGPMEFLL